MLAGRVIRKRAVIGSKKRLNTPFTTDIDNAVAKHGETMPEEKSEDLDIKPDDTSLRDAIEEAAKEEPVEAAEEAPAEPEKEEESSEEAAESDVEAVDEAVEEPDDEVLDAPTHWALEDQETFRALDPKAQQFLLGRSKEMEAAHTKRSQEIAPLRKSVERWQPYLDRVGATPELAFDRLMDIEAKLRTGTEQQRRDTILQIAKDYAISLEEPKANGADMDFLSADIQKAVGPLQQEVGTLREAIAQRETAAQQAQASQMAERIQQFRDEKTEAGQPAHPYFDEVLDDMNVLAQAQQARGTTPDLAQLYDTAVHANPTVRAKIQAAQQHAAKLKQKREQKEKVEKAKSTDVSVTGVSTAPKEQPKSLRASIEEAFAS